MALSLLFLVSRFSKCCGTAPLKEHSASCLHNPDQWWALEGITYCLSTKSFRSRTSGTEDSQEDPTLSFSKQNCYWDDTLYLCREKSKNNFKNWRLVCSIIWPWPAFSLVYHNFLNHTFLKQITTRIMFKMFHHLHLFFCICQMMLGLLPFTIRDAAAPRTSHGLPILKLAAQANVWPCLKLLHYYL